MATALTVTHSLRQHPLPGIDEARLRSLADEGLTSLEDLVSAGATELARITGFGLDTSRALVRVAQGALASVDPNFVEFVPPHTEAASKRLARGLRGARDIEMVRSLAQSLRTRFGRRPSRPSWQKSHKRALKQLQRLIVALEDLQRDVLTDGLSRTALHHLREQLAPLEEHLSHSISARPRKREFKRAAKRAKAARRLFSGRTSE